MSARMRSQLRTLFPVLMGLYIPMLIVVLIAVLVSFQLSIPIASLTRDPSATTGESPFLGALSNIGILFWCASTAICFFTFAVLHKKALRGNFQAFFLFSGLISLILLLDDLFLLHEMVFPIYLKIPEKLIFLSYGLMILIYLVKFTKTIIKTDFIFITFAFCFFGLSIIIDLLGFGISILLEDGSKLFGIVSWFGYFARTCFQVVKYTILQPIENCVPPNPQFGESIR